MNEMKRDNTANFFYLMLSVKIRKKSLLKKKRYNVSQYSKHRKLIRYWDFDQKTTHEKKWKALQQI